MSVTLTSLRCVYLLQLLRHWDRVFEPGAWLYASMLLLSCVGRGLANRRFHKKSYAKYLKSIYGVRAKFLVATSHRAYSKTPKDL